MIIGITLSKDRDFFKLNENYIKAIKEFKATALMLSYSENTEELMELVDGILLTGGGDIDARFLNEPQHPLSTDVYFERDLFEIELCRAALKKNIPVLGICRGAQIMSVAAGGKIEQNIDGHFQNKPKDKTFHSVRILEKSKLFSIIGKNIIETNSLHHQAVTEAGEDMRVSAWAFDGTAEAIEHKNKRFYLGVQWHPEALWTKKEEQKNIFEEFARACLLGNH